MSALDLCAALLGVAVLLQTLELILLRPAWGDGGIWQWESVRPIYAEWPAPVRATLDAWLNERAYLCILATVFVASLVLVAGTLPVPGGLEPHNARAISTGLANAIAAVTVFLGTWLTALRWGGRFNGGSDSMTAIVAVCIAIARFIGTPASAHACLGYIAVQLSASYFIAGIGKLTSADWRSGLALQKFIEIPGYDRPPEWIRRALASASFARLASAGVLIFECTFPLAWVGPRTCAAYLTAALVFHLLNYRVFGLNRFFFAWLAAYPALFFWSAR